MIPEGHSSFVLIAFMKTCNTCYGVCLLRNTAVVGKCAVHRGMVMKQC
jgi:hypothetical protein